MAVVIGHVKTMKGKFVAESKDGQIRELKSGDPIYEGDAVYGNNKAQGAEASGTNIKIALTSGKEMAISETGYALFDPSVMGKDFDFVEVGSKSQDRLTRQAERDGNNDAGLLNNGKSKNLDDGAEISTNPGDKPFQTTDPVKNTEPLPPNTTNNPNPWPVPGDDSKQKDIDKPEDTTPGKEPAKPSDTIFNKPSTPGTIDDPVTKPPVTDTPKPPVTVDDTPKPPVTPPVDDTPKPPVEPPVDPKPPVEPPVDPKPPVEPKPVENKLPPVIDLDGDHNTAPGTSYLNAFKVKGGPVTIGDIDTLITDSDSKNLKSAVVTLVDAKSGDSVDVSAINASKFAVSVNSAVPGKITISISGDNTKADYQNAINSIKFVNNTGKPDLSDRHFEVSVNDGDFSSNTAVATIKVVSTPEPPKIDLDGDDSTATGTSHLTTFKEGSGGIPIADIDIKITDEDSLNLKTAEIILTNAKPGDSLDTGGIDLTKFGVKIDTSTPGKIKIILTGEQPLSEYQNAIKNIKFNNSSTEPDTEDRKIEVTVNDGGLSSNTAVATIKIVPVNEPPKIDLDGDDSTAPVTEYLTTFTEKGSSVKISDIDIKVTDDDSKNMKKAVVELANAKDGDILDASSVDASKFTVKTDTTAAGKITITLTGDASKADYQTAINSIKFTNSSESPDTADRKVEVFVNDGISNSNTATATIKIIPVNSPPEVDLDGNDSSASGTSYKVNYNVNGTRISIADNDRTVTDTDDTHMESAKIVLANAKNGDDLDYSGLDANKFTAVKDTSVPGKITITLTGHQSKADYQDAINSIMFRNPSGFMDRTDRKVEVTVNDGDHDSNTAVATISIKVAYPIFPPEIDLDKNDSSTATGKDHYSLFTENGPAVKIADLDTFITDSDSTNMVSAKVILTNAKSGDDLTVNLIDPKFEVTKDASVPGKITITIKGNQTIADYQTAISSIKFANPDNNLDPADRIINISVNDGTSDSNIAVSKIDISNTPPVIDLDGNDNTATAGNKDYQVTYVENGAGVNISDADTVVTDVNDTQMDRAVIVLTNAKTGDDLNTAGVNLAKFTVTKDTSVAGKITVTLVNQQTKADYQTAINAIKFVNSSDDPDGTDRIINVKVNDGESDSNIAVSTIHFTVVNDPPVIDLDSNNSSGKNNADYQAAFTEKGASVSISDIDTTVTDPDDTHMETATIILTNLKPGDDLDITGVGVGFNAVKTTNAGDITVTFTGHQTKADYQSAINAVKFTNSSNNPDTTDRVITVKVNDGNVDSNVATSTIHITPVNDPPVIDLDFNNSSGKLVADYQTTFTENGASVSISDADTTVTDPDDTHMETALIILTNKKAGDDLNITAVGAGFNAVKTVNAGDITVTFTGHQTKADYQTAINAIKFTNSSDDPDTTDRTITVKVNDGDSNSNVATSTIHITPVNDPPVIDLDANDNSGKNGADYQTTFTENGAGVSISDTDRTVNDLDDTHMETATIILTNLKPGDDLDITSVGAGFTPVKTVNAGNNITITFTGHQTKADYQTAINAVKFVNTSENPDTTDRIITVKVNDGDVDSNVATSTIHITPVNDPPVLDLDLDDSSLANNSTYTFTNTAYQSTYAGKNPGDSINTAYQTTFTEKASGVSISHTDPKITDPDSANMASARIVLTNMKALDDLDVTGIDVAKFTISKTVVPLTSITVNLTAIGGRTQAELQTAINAIKFNNTSNNPDITDRVVNVYVSDGTANSNTATAIIHTVGVNDRPTVNDVAVEDNKDAAYITVTLSGNDPDSNISHFKITSLPLASEGVLYKTIPGGVPTGVVALNEEIAVTATNQLTLYFKPDYDPTVNTHKFGRDWFNLVGDTVTFQYKAVDTNHYADSNNVTLLADYTSTNTGTATITIDDVPYAMPSADKTVVENFAATPDAVTTGGNVLTDGVTFANGADYQSLRNDSPCTVKQVKFTDLNGNYSGLNALNAGDNTFNADFGKLVINTNGTYTFTPKPGLVHPNDGTSDLTFKFSYNIVETNGDHDVSNIVEQVIKIQDGAAPSIGSPVNSAVDEQYLPTGSNSVPANLTKTGALNVTFGTDPVDVVFKGTQTSLNALINHANHLSSKGQDISYVLSNSDHTLTAKAGGVDVFTVTINNPDNNGGGATYTFQLLKPLDHENGITFNNSGTDNDLDSIFDNNEIHLTFDVRAKNTDDFDHDYSDKTFQVAIIDDNPPSKNVTTNEDTVKNFTTNADATFANTKIDSTGLSTGTTMFGSATVQADGTITYTPNANVSTGIDFQDTFTYTTKLDTGVDQQYTVNVKVNPIADTPTWPANKTIICNEDDANIALNLSLPTKTDIVDQTVGNNDHGERIGLITISGIPTGAVLKNGGTTLTPTAGAVTVYVDNGGLDTNHHYTGLNIAGAVALTQAQFEGLTITPKTDSAANFTLVLTTTEYEVFDDNTSRGLPGATSSQNILVDVKAISDAVTITKATDASGTEDEHNNNTWVRIDDKLNLGMVDSDGSEKYYLEFSNMARNDIQFKVGAGSAQTISGGTFSTSWTGTTKPAIYIRNLNNNDSRDIDNIIVKFQSEDNDDTAPLIVTKSLQQTIDVNLNVDFVPVANDISISSVGGTGNEDTKIPLNLVFTINDASESVTTLTIAGIPDGAKIYDSTDGNVLYTSTGPGHDTYIATIAGANSFPGTITMAEAQALKILPPKDSNADFTLSITADTKDNDDGGGQPFVTGTATASVNIVVKGVVDTSLGDLDTADAGRLKTFINGVQTVDVNADKIGDEVLLSGNEDSEINLGMSWLTYETAGGADTSEGGTFIIRNQTGYNDTFTLTNGSGTQIGTKVAGGWQITGLQLATAHLKPFANFSNTNANPLKLELVSTIKESGGADNPFDTNVQTDLFKIVVNPIADTPTIQVREAFTTEDTAAKLDIRPYTPDTDGSEEAISVLVADIPAGAVIKLQNGTTIFVNDSGVAKSYLFTVDAAATETGKVSSLGATGGTILLADLGKLYIVPPAHLNGDFILKVTPTVWEKDNHGSTASSAPINVTIHIKGQADTPTLQLNDHANANAGIKVNGTPMGNGTSQNFTDGQTIEIYGPERNGGDNAIPIGLIGKTGELVSIELSSSPLFTQAKNGADGAGDVSEKLSFKISGLPTNFVLVNAITGGTQVGNLLEYASGKITWSVTAAEVAAGLFIKAPNDYSGVLTGLKLTTIVTENDGHSTLRELPFSLKVYPVVTSNPIANVTGSEDAGPGAGNTKGTLIDLNFSNMADATGSEQITEIKIYKSGVPAGLKIYVNNGGWVEANTLGVSVNKNDGADYFDLTAYKNATAVGVDPAGAYLNKHVDANILNITGVNIKITDGNENGSASTTESSLINQTINVKLDGVADQPVINAFTGTFDDPVNGNVASVNVNVTFPDNDGSETHYYTIKLPGTPSEGWGFNQGHSNGDKTWFFKTTEVAGLKVVGPDGFTNATLELTAYSVENGTEKATAIFTITDPAVGSGGGLGGGTLLAQVPTLGLKAMPSITEDNSFNLGAVVNAATTQTNDTDIGGNETLGFIIRDIPTDAKVTVANGVILYNFIDSNDKPASRIDIPVGMSLADALTNITIKPVSNYSGDFKFTIKAIATELNSSMHHSRIDAGGENNVTVRVTPVADDFKINNATASSIVEDTKTQIKFTLSSLDDKFDASDLTETSDNIKLSITEGKLVDSAGNDLGNNIGVYLTGDVVKKNTTNEIVYYQNTLHKHGNFTVTVTADTHDTTNYPDPLTLTNDKLAVVKTISIGVTSDPDVPTSANGGLTVKTVGGGVDTTLYTTNEDTKVQMNLGVNFVDNDGSEMHTILLRIKPSSEGASIAAKYDGALLVNNADARVGNYVGNGVWELQAADFANLYFKPQGNLSGDLVMQIGSKVIEKDNLTNVAGDWKDFTIHMNQVADGAVITPWNVYDAKIDEFTRAYLEPLRVEQGEYNTSPIKQGAGDTNPGQPFVSDELYKVSFENMPADGKFYYKNGAEYYLMADEDPNATIYTMSKLTQTQMENLYFKGDNHLSGTFGITAKVYTQEVDGGNNLMNESAAVQDTLTLKITGASTNPAVTFHGTSGNDTLHGGGGNDTIHGGDGNDTIDGFGGSNTINAGNGDDTIVFHSTDTVDGGAGKDTFILDTGLNINFNDVMASKTAMEVFDLRVNGNHTIDNLHINDVLAMADTNHELIIRADAGDVVRLQNDAAKGGSWVANGTFDDGGTIYNVYDLQGNVNALTLKVENTITAQII